MTCNPPTPGNAALIGPLRHVPAPSQIRKGTLAPQDVTESREALRLLPVPSLEQDLSCTQITGGFHREDQRGLVLEPAGRENPSCSISARAESCWSLGCFCPQNIQHPKTSSPPPPSFALDPSFPPWSSLLPPCHLLLFPSFLPLRIV